MWSNLARPELLAWLLALMAVTAQARNIPPDLAGGLPESGGYQAALVTYGPGDIYWQRFGHNALWLQEPDRGLNHAFNFGLFDFEQENFMLRFVQGRMLYLASAIPAQREIEFYRSEGRSVRIQVLDLTPEQYMHLRDHLIWHVQPENNTYLYDYYLDNCSTRLRDALDLSLDGSLQTQFAAQPALQDFRAHTRRSTIDSFWYYLGLELALGMPVDQVISRWDEMFLPAVLADNLTEVSQLAPGGLAPLVASDQWLYPGTVEPVPARPAEVWWRYLAFGLALVIAAIAWQRFMPAQVSHAMALAWMLIGGTMGCLMVADWLWTDHHAANPNINLLLFNPLWLLAMWPGLRRPVVALLAVSGLLALTLTLVGVQYSHDVVALLLPMNLAAALGLWWTPGPDLSPD